MIGGKYYRTDQLVPLLMKLSNPNKVKVPVGATFVEWKDGKAPYSLLSGIYHFLVSNEWVDSLFWEYFFEQSMY